MKKIKLFALAAFALLSTNTFAQTKADGSYRYEITGASTAKIIGFVANSEQAVVNIPTQVQDPDNADKKYDVTAIAIEAFKGQTGITSVTIPDTKVATIMAGAFAGCTNLTTVTIGKAVTLIDNVKVAATYSVVPGGSDLTHDATYYTSATGAGEFIATDDAMYDNVAADTYWTLTTPATLEGAFAGCTKLATVTFNPASTAGNQTIAAGTFIGTAITNLNLANTKVATVERLFTDGATKTNAKLAEVTFPATMTDVVNDAFNGCSALATVNFTTPTNNQNIGNGAFVGTAISTLDLSGSKVTEINQLFTNGTVTSNVKLTTVKLSKETTDINWRAFYGCAKLSEIVWATEGKLTNIWGNAFEVTPSLTSLNVPSSVQALKPYFLAGSSITSLTINANATDGKPTVGVSGSTKLKTLTVAGAFKGTITGVAATYTVVPGGSDLTHDATYYTSATGAGEFIATDDAMYDNVAADTYWTLTTPDEYAFGTLESVTFEGNLAANAIGLNAFGGAKLKTATFKGEIAANAIGGGAFAGATKLATVTFEKKISANGVDAGAFDGAGTANTAVAGIKMTVNYSPAEADEVATAFNVAAFAAAATPKYVAFVTTTHYGPAIVGLNAVIPMFDAPAVEIEVANNGTGDWYYAKFYKDTNYSIAKEQESGAKVIVYGAYVDNSDKNIYMEQLHIINGKYQIPGGAPVIIKSSTADKVKAVSGIEASSMLENGGFVSNEIAYLPAITVGQVLKEETNDFDAVGRGYDNANDYDVYALGKIEKFNITWKKFGDSTQLPEGTFYIHCKKSNAARLNVIWLDGSEPNDEATAIQTVKNEVEDGAIYNLAGQKVNAAFKGVVIKNGKKFMQK